LTSPSSSGRFLVAVEGGGTRTQAALFDPDGRLLHTADAADVNVNFTTPERAVASIVASMTDTLRLAGVAPEEVGWAAYALVTAREVAQAALRQACPAAALLPYREPDVVFARARHYRPHGVAVVAGTGATAWAMRRGEGWSVSLGGWGSLLGDEGSGYALGLAGLRTVAKAWEGRESPTALVDAARRFFSLDRPDLKETLIQLVYRKPLSRAEIAAFAAEVVRTATADDAVANRLVAATVEDLADLALHAARRSFSAAEPFVVAVAGGLLNAGDVVLGPLRQKITAAFPCATVVTGTEEPAVALGRLALYDLSHP
jgi:N-acetylglucosamine kinase-like BadF-type ATPase